MILLLHDLILLKILNTTKRQKQDLGSRQTKEHDILAIRDDLWYSLIKDANAREMHVQRETPQVHGKS